MNPEFSDLVNQLILHWEGAAVQRIIVGLLGLGILVQTIRARTRHKCSGPMALIWILLAIAMMLFAGDPQGFITVVISTEYITRIRIIMAALSLLVLLITWENVRSTQLQERYALLWVATSLIVLICALFPAVVDLFRAVSGMSYVMAVVSVMFTFLLLVAFHFSITLSSMALKHSKVAQRVAILEARLQTLEDAATQSTTES